MKKDFNQQLPDEAVAQALLVLLSKILETLQTSHQQDSQYYDSADVKRLMKIGDTTLYRYRKSQKIPSVKIGKKIFYPKSFFNNVLK